MKLIDADKLKKAVEELVVGGAEGLKDYYENGSKSDENAWIGGVYDAWEQIDNAPTIMPKEFEPLVEAIIDALPDLVEKTIPAIVEKIERPTGEWILHGMIYYCSNCGHDCGESGDNFCGNCGSKMKKEERR